MMDDWILCISQGVSASLYSGEICDCGVKIILKFDFIWLSIHFLEGGVGVWYRLLHC